MSSTPPDEWPRLLSLIVHEFRTPLTVTAGYIRMLLRGTAGPVSDSQRRILEQADQACARLTALLGEVSELGKLEGRTLALERQRLALAPVLAAAVGEVQVPDDHGITVESTGDLGDATVLGDGNRLRAAFRSLATAVARETALEGKALVDARVEGDKPGSRRAVVVMADARIHSGIAAQDTASLAPVDEWRGGLGVGIPLARRVIEAHGGHVLSPPGEVRQPAIVAVLPLVD